MHGAETEEIEPTKTMMPSAPEEEALLPDDDDLGFPDIPSAGDEEPAPNRKKKLKKKAVPQSSKKSPKNFKKRNDRFIVVILAIAALLIFRLVFYYRQIINKPIPLLETKFELLPPADAQEATLGSQTKKKALLVEDVVIDDLILESKIDLFGYGIKHANFKFDKENCPSEMTYSTQLSDP